MEAKGNTDFREIILLEFFDETFRNSFWNFRFLVFSASIKKKTPFLAVFTVFAGLLLASNVQRWIRDVQKCSLNQLWPETSKLKSAGAALNIAENAKISESALKMTEYLWERFISTRDSRAFLASNKIFRYDKYQKPCNTNFVSFEVFPKKRIPESLMLPSLWLIKKPSWKAINFRKNYETYS